MPVVIARDVSIRKLDLPPGKRINASKFFQQLGRSEGKIIQVLASLKKNKLRKYNSLTTLF